MSVYAVLQQGADQQYVFVHRTDENIDKPIESEELFLKDAQVNVESSLQSINFLYHYDSLHYSSPSRYIDNDQNIIITPGEKYTLTIKTDIGVLTGETTLPNPIKLISPLNGSQIVENYDLDIIWENDETAYGYVIKLEGPQYQWQASDGSIYKRRDSYFFNTTNNAVLIPSNQIIYNEDNQWYNYIGDDRQYTIKVMGFDKNFKQHKFDGYPIAGVENGYGVFGSVVVDSLDFYVIK